MVCDSIIKGIVKMQKYILMINDIRANSVGIFFNWTAIPHTSLII